ncbi:UPF0271 protein PH0986 [Candidatus Vecturithrix granuli]|uniref:5-oxoprolinase subunit A n=1 Tax=Vecturithrix granuli TaxID=1499967 RepID=A0A081C3J2_VECG1|nr:UPF0271 protein PH0986 [Candidatus Vecturithrix granuli]
MKIDINCDMGESFGRYQLGLDAEIMPFISSANIACGFHAGDPSVMHKTVQMAVEHGVGVGAHPGFPDLVGFGRRNLNMLTDELRDAIIYQVGALMGFTQMLGANIQHVKPHGAMYNMAAENESMAKTIIETLLKLNDQLILFGLSGSKILSIARKSGLRVACEVFADRAYNEDGSLVSRQQPGSVITDSSEVANRILKMVKERKVTAITGLEIDLELDTICVHGDTAGAVDHVKHIVHVLKQEGIEIAPVGKFL